MKSVNKLSSVDIPHQDFILKTTNQGEFVYENNAISGYDMYDGVRSYLYLEFDRIPVNIKVRERDEISDRTSISGRRVELIAFFNPESAAELKIRYGLSYISTEQARKNLQADISGWDLNELSGKARENWNSVLSGIISAMK